MQDASTLEQTLAYRLRLEREVRGWSLSDLSQRANVSRAMISKVERGEASPTAALLGRLSGAFGLTLSALLARAENDGAGAGRLSRAAAQPIWRDPDTGYTRRAVSPAGAEPELVLVDMPPGARVSYPAASYVHLRGQCIWVLSGALWFREGGACHHLSAGDCLALGPPMDCEFHNQSLTEHTTYVVALVKR